LAPRLAILVCLMAAACSRAKTADEARDEACEEPESYERVEVWFTTAPQPRPYRVVGAVEANFDMSSEGRLRTLRIKACRLGADAITFSERAVQGPRYGSGQVVGNTATVTMWGSGHTVASGLAIAFTDRAGPSSDFGSAAQPTR
jgi:hypothetical protein